MRSSLPKTSTTRQITPQIRAPVRVMTVHDFPTIKLHTLNRRITSGKIPVR